jgi:hypothetical protein
VIKDNTANKHDWVLNQDLLGETQISGHRIALSNTILVVRPIKHVYHNSRHVKLTIIFFCPFALYLVPVQIVSNYYLSFREFVGLLRLRIGPFQCPYLHRNTANIHISSGIRTQESSVRIGEDVSCLKSHGNCDRQQKQNIAPTFTLQIAYLFY